MTTVDATMTPLPGVDSSVELVPLFRGVWKLSPYVLVPDGPSGTRAIIGLPEGRLEGRGIVAKTHDGLNADWMTVGPDGTGSGDWRGSVMTEDGAVIYVHGHGRADLSGGFGNGAMLIGGALFETGDERYRWLNKVQAVYRGVVVGDGSNGEAVYHDEWFELR
jgi:Protein of unknown function (DUF3237)